MSIFSKIRQWASNKMQRWREVGEYTATFNQFGGNIWKSDVVRSCVRPLANFTSKAHFRCSNPSIEKMMNSRPNMYMNGREFLKKIRTMYEIRNNVFILIDRDNTGKCVGLFPIPYSTFQALEYNGKLFIQFSFTGGEQLTVSWDDLAVIRKDYNESSISGDDNNAIIQQLELIYTTNQGISHAVRATANLRGILKSTKSMLSPEDVRRNKDEFVHDYLSLENEGGIASLDASMEFIPINMNPVVTSYAQMREFRENIYRYFGVNEKIITCNLTPAELETVYELMIEPFLADLSEELQSKVFTKREQAFNWIVCESNRLQFASLEKKIHMFSTVVLYGGMTINEWRLACNMAPIEGGDELIRRLDAATVDDQPKEGNEDDQR